MKYVLGAGAVIIAVGIVAVLDAPGETATASPAPTITASPTTEPTEEPTPEPTQPTPEPTTEQVLMTEEDFWLIFDVVLGQQFTASDPEVESVCLLFELSPELAVNTFLDGVEDGALNNGLPEWDIYWDRATAAEHVDAALKEACPA